MTAAKGRRDLWDAHRALIEGLVESLPADAELRPHLIAFRNLMVTIELWPKLAAGLAPSSRDRARYRDDLAGINRDLLARMDRVRTAAMSGGDSTEIQRAFDKGAPTDSGDEARKLRRSKARMKKLGRPRGLIVKRGSGPA